jgi:hypothetical protein
MHDRRQRQMCIRDRYKNMFYNNPPLKKVTLEILKEVIIDGIWHHQ